MKLKFLMTWLLMERELVDRVSICSAMMGKMVGGEGNKPVLVGPAPALSHGFGGDTDDML